MSKEIVAIVGRPNVGKSTLFNKLVGKRISIVDKTPGLTRDRIYSECEWIGKKFLLVDTGGIEDCRQDEILCKMKQQAQIAIDTASVVIFVTDLISGVVATDLEVAAMLKRSGKPVILCVNKCDTVGDVPAEIYEFYNIGMGEPIPVSAVHGHGTGDLLDKVLENLKGESLLETDSSILNIALIGKPNVGKSSLVNALTGEDRCIVSDVAGTTRDSIDTLIKTSQGTFNIIDTAGLRRKSKVDTSVERYSVIRSQMAVGRSDVCVIMIDAKEGFTEQDSKVAGLAHNQGKGCVIAVNKWDAIEKDDKTMYDYKRKISQGLSFMSYAPIVFISAKTGQRLDDLLSTVVKVANSNAMRITTGKLNDVLAEATTKVQPPSDKGKRLKIFYMTQPSTKPPTFICFINSTKLFHFSYQRYLENKIRQTFGMTGTPIRIIGRERGEGKNNDGVHC